MDVSGAIRVDGHYRGCGRHESHKAAWLGDLSFLGPFLAVDVSGIVCMDRRKPGCETQKQTTNAWAMPMDSMRLSKTLMASPTSESLSLYTGLTVKCGSVASQ